MSTLKPVLTGTVGLGGYGAAILRALTDGEAAQPPMVKLTAACSSSLARHAEAADQLRQRGVKLFESYEALLAEPVEAVWLPLPIDLHRPYTVQALEAGKAVMCEKPAAGCVDDVDAMIAARDKHKLPVAIGYQDVYDPTTLPLKRKLLDGAIGRISHATLFACWPRDNMYYSRSSWAGAFKRDGHWVMDSPANNALAHYINIGLFLMGPTLQTSANPVAVEAELYRARDIENFDTISMKLTLEGGSTFLVLLTHACQEQHHPLTTFHGSKGTVTRSIQDVVIKAGGGEERMVREGKPMPQMVKRFTEYVRGVPDDQIGLCTLEVARAQLVAVNGASEAVEVQDVPAQYVKPVTNDRGGTIQTIQGIEAVFAQCAQKNQMLSESKLLPWTQTPGHKDLHGYRHFAGPKGVKLAAT